MSTLKRQVVTLLAGLLVAGLGMFTAQAPASASMVTKGSLFGPYTIRPLGDWSKCLDVTDISQSNGALLQMYDCLGSQQYNQVFYFWAVEGTATRYQITPAHSWKCLDVRDMSLFDFAPIQQYTCLGANQANQIFDVYNYNDVGGMAITATHSWKRVIDGGPNNGASVFQYPQWDYWILYNA